MAYVDHISVDGVQYDIRDAEAVSFEQDQTLTNAQQEQARENIGAGSETDVADLKSQFDDTLDLLEAVRDALINEDPEEAINLIDTFLIDHGRIAPYSGGENE